MTGASVTICRLDGELERLLKAPCRLRLLDGCLTAMGLTVEALKAGCGRDCRRKLRPRATELNAPGRQARRRRPRRDPGQGLARGRRRRCPPRPTISARRFLASPRHFNASRLLPSERSPRPAFMAAAKRDQGSGGATPGGSVGAACCCGARRDDGAGQRRAWRQDRARQPRRGGEGDRGRRRPR